MMNKLALAIIFLLFPVACSAQAEFTLSCENVTKIHIGRFETKYWIVESEDGYYYILFAELAKDGHKQLATLREASPYSYIPKEDGRKIVVEAGTEITFKAGGSFVKLSPAGITFSGQPVKINSGGSPGSGSGAGPVLPTEALLVGKAAVPDGVEHVEIVANEPPPVEPFENMGACQVKALNAAGENGSGSAESRPVEDN